MVQFPYKGGTPRTERQWIQTHDLSITNLPSEFLTMLQYLAVTK